MSYFATVANVNASHWRIAGLGFVPLSSPQAPRYLRELSPVLAALDGVPIFFCDDGATGTSTDFIDRCQAVARATGSLDGTGLPELLRRCAATGGRFRLWWAGAGPDAFRQVVSSRSEQETLRHLVATADLPFWGVHHAP